MPILKGVVTGQGSSWLGVWVEMSREASFFECALRVFSSCRAGRLSDVDVSEVKKQHPGGSPGDDLSCVWVLGTGEEPMQEVVGEHVNLLALHPTTRKPTENY